MRLPTFIYTLPVLLAGLQGVAAALHPASGHHNDPALRIRRNGPARDLSQIEEKRALEERTVSTKVTSCKPLFYLDNGVCVRCKDLDALTCNATVSLSCNFAYLLTPPGKCVTPCPSPLFADVTSHKCVIACSKTGEYLDTTSRQCKACADTNALTCNATSALTCAKGSFLSAGACVKVCPKYTAPNSVLNTCVHCVANAVTCTSSGAALTCLKGSGAAPEYVRYNGICIATCPTGTYANAKNDECYPCSDPNASTCMATAALSCGTGYLSQGVCVTTCPVSTFAAPGGHTCLACPPSALTCSTAGALSCRQSTYLYQSQCVAACPALTAANSTLSTCVPCVSGAATCSQTGAALTCASTFHFYKSTCPATCPATTFVDPTTGDCAACQTGAESCTSPTLAQSCGVVGGVQYFLSNGQCLTECPVWAFGDVPTQTCQRCDLDFPFSAACNSTGATICGLESESQTYLTANQNCVLPAQCPSATWPQDFNDQQDFKCTSCDDGTATCVHNGAGGALTCGSSSAGVAYFLDTALSTCVTNCSITYFNDAATSICTLCPDGDSYCTGDASGDALVCGLDKFGVQTYLNPSKNCVEAAGCPAAGAFYAGTTSNTCVACDAGVAACTRNGPGGATACLTDPASGAQLFLDPSNNCVFALDCPAATFPNTADNQCDVCADGVALCNSLTDAYLCGVSVLNAGVQLYLDDGLCVTSANCASGTYGKPGIYECSSCTDFDSEAKTCTLALGVLTCRNPYYAYLSLVPSESRVGNCLPEGDCLTTTYVDSSSRTCTPCESIQDGSATCTATSALSCLNGYYLLNGECPTSCPSSYYADPIANVCTPCSEIASNSLTCVSEPFDDQALSCAVPYYISQDPDTGDQSCVATCPAGTTAYQNYDGIGYRICI